MPNSANEEGARCLRAFSRLGGELGDHSGDGALVVADELDYIGYRLAIVPNQIHGLRYLGPVVPQNVDGFLHVCDVEAIQQLLDVTDLARQPRFLSLV